MTRILIVIYNSLHLEHEELMNKSSWTQYELDVVTTNAIFLENQINNLQTSEKDYELNEERKEVGRLNGMLQEAEKRESNWTNQLKEKYNKGNKHDKGLENNITSLKGELQETKNIKDVLRIQLKKKEEDFEK